MQKIFLLTFFYYSFCYGSFTLHPVAKSFLMPGSGERDLGYYKSSKFFMQSEILLFTACYSAFRISDIIEHKYISYAAQHAGATSPIDERYWTDIGNYNTNNDFDSEHLRMRDFKEGQWSDHPWDWQSDHFKRKKFENMRIKSDKYFLVGKFLIGGVIMNHIISSINTLYISNINKDNTLSLKPLIQKSNGIYRYGLFLEF
tara:strand:+ start:2079 stop:2681 length:603 start_codon:yes stop_codon:yes gene_type:complete